MVGISVCVNPMFTFIRFTSTNQTDKFLPRIRSTSTKQPKRTHTLTPHETLLVHIAKRESMSDGA